MHQEPRKNKIAAVTVFKRQLPTIAVVVALAMTAGCTASRMGISATEMRNSLIEFNQDQVIDNVIRSYNKLPIVHYDIGDVDATVKSEIGAEMSGGQTLTNTSKTLPVVELAREAVRPFTFGVSPSASDSLTLTMTPVTTSNSVYSNYEKFSAIEGAVVVSDRKPRNADDVHIMKRWNDGKYYWVPKSFAADFFNLSMYTAVKRQPELLPKNEVSRGDRSVQNGAQQRFVPSPAQPQSGDNPTDALKDVARELKLQRLQ